MSRSLAERAVPGAAARHCPAYAALSSGQRALLYALEGACERAWTEERLSARQVAETLEWVTTAAWAGGPTIYADGRATVVAW